MINDIATLLELVRQLVARKSELDKTFFENFIQPIWESFCVIHQDYKESFSRYRDLTNKGEGDPQAIVDSLLEGMKKDSIYTADLRSDLDNLIRNLPSNTFKVEESYLSDFIQSINSYFQRGPFHEAYPNYYYDGYESLQNLRCRLESSIELRMRRAKHYHQDIQRIVVPVIDASMKYIQSSYEEVAKTYYRLRNQLLS